MVAGGERKTTMSDELTVKDIALAIVLYIIIPGIVALIVANNSHDIWKSAGAYVITFFVMWAIEIMFR